MSKKPRTHRTKSNHLVRISVDDWWNAYADEFCLGLCACDDCASKYEALKHAFYASVNAFIVAFGVVAPDGQQSIVKLLKSVNEDCKKYQAEQEKAEVMEAQMESMGEVKH